MYSLLSEGSSEASVSATLAEMRQDFRDQWTNTGAAIALMSDVIFVASNGDRSDVSNVGVIITDGPSNRFPQLTIPNAQVRKTKKHKINVHVHVNTFHVFREPEQKECRC